MKKILNDKYCKDCLVSLTEDNTNEYDILSAQYVCKNCRKLRDKQKYQNRKEIIREKQRLHDLSVKLKVIAAYGGKCFCCGENTPEFLTVDYIKRENNDKKSGGRLYRWLIKNNFPKEKYQILCHNCSCAKELFGYCPHNKIENNIESITSLAIGH